MGERDDRADGDHESTKPASLIRYKGKIGVDRADQMSCYYPMCRKTQKWWKVFFRALHHCTRECEQI